MIEDKDKKPILKIIGENGNAFNLLGIAMKVAKENNMDWDKIQNEAMNGNYNHLLWVLNKYFDIK